MRTNEIKPEGVGGAEMRVPLRVVAEHHCRSHHRSAAAFARCAWPVAMSVTGTGPFALLTCRPLGISLWPTHARAQEAKAGVDVAGCGRACTHEHEVVAVDYDGAEAAA